MSEVRPVQEQLRRAAEAFRRRFERAPTVAAVAPGRVNLIGEHTDYNDGFVLPMAIERQTLIVAAPAPRGGTASPAAPLATIVSTDQPDPAVFPVDATLKPGEPRWANYVRGVVAHCRSQGLDPGGFDALIDSTVPLGGGLSSSAALEMATATLIEALVGRNLDPVAKALIGQRAEHTFAGVPCGIMDQFIATLAQPGHAMLLDCRSHQTRMVPLADPDLVVLVANTNVKHELTGGEYARRRAQCEAAARALGVNALRDATLPMLEAARDRLDPIAWRRARHVIGENARTLAAAEAMARGDWDRVGRLMYESHDSLRDDYEVSCPELDLLVDLARQAPGATGSSPDAAGAARVYGARMTGGGFGGCTVTLLQKAAVPEISRRLTTEYQARTGKAPTVFATRPAGGARPLPLA